MSDEASLFWIEPERMARLMERLDTPKATVRPSQEPGQQEPPPADPLDDTVSVVMKAPDVGIGAPLAQYQVSSGSIEERLAGLLDWLRDVTAPRQAFVTDGEGLALAGDTEPETVAVAARLAGTWEELRGVCSYPEDGALSIDAPGGGCLHLLRATTPWGMLHLGFVATRELPSTTLDQIREAFRRTVEEKEPHS